MPTSPFTTLSSHTEFQRRQIDELVEFMSPREVGFLKIVGIDGEAGTNPKLEWMEKQLLFEVGSVSGTIANTSVTNFLVPYDDLIHYQAAELIKIEDEYMWIKSVTTDGTSATLTVDRASCGTTAATHATTGVSIELVGLANLEGADSPLAGTTEFVENYNRYQDFDTSYKITFKQANTSIHGVKGNPDTDELQQAFEQVTIKLENSAVKGLRQDPSTTVPGALGGLAHFVSATTTGYHYGMNAGAALLAEKDINDMLEAVYYKVGSQYMGKTLLVPPWQKRRINDIYAPYARMERNERKGGVIVDTIDTDHGPIDVLMTMRCPKDKIYLLNLDYISIHPYEGLAFYDDELARSGAYRIRQIFGSYSMKIKNTRSMGVIYNLAYS
jgi:hypothetical protein